MGDPDSVALLLNKCLIRRQNRRDGTSGGLYSSKGGREAKLDLQQAGEREAVEEEAECLADWY